jgi:hypothetical protein
MIEIDESLKKKNKGDPLLAMAGQIAGTAVGNVVTPGIGGQIGGSLGGQLAGTGTIDPAKTALALGTGAISDKVTGALTDTIKENVTAPMTDALNSNFMENTGMSPMEMKEYGMETSMLDYMPNRFGFASGGPISYAACGGKMKYRAEGSTAAERSRNAGGAPYINKGVLSAVNNEIDPFFEGDSPVYNLISDYYHSGDPYAEELYNELLKQEELRKVRDLYENPIGIIRRADGSDEPEMSAEELARREAEMKRRMMQEEMYERNKRAHKAAGEGYYFGPLKSTQYKSAGGEVYTQNYYNPKEK